ncbi:MAG: hypothetical protein L6Q94_22145 [Calditrichia bacterium]|nr:hypothetical protein [Calditrichia bacterium]
MFLHTDETGTVIGADRLRKIARFAKSLPTERDHFFGGQRTTPFGQGVFQDRAGRGHVANLQEREFLLRAMQRLLDDEIYLPQLM